MLHQYTYTFNASFWSSVSLSCHCKITYHLLWFQCTIWRSSAQLESVASFPFSTSLVITYEWMSHFGLLCPENSVELRSLSLSLLCYKGMAMLLSTPVMLWFSNPSQHSHASRHCFCEAMRLRFPRPTTLDHWSTPSVSNFWFVGLLSNNVVHLLEPWAVHGLHPTKAICQVASANLKLPTLTVVIKTNHTM